MLVVVLANSIDAGATSIDINVNLSLYRLSVADDGRGIPCDKLQSLVATAHGELSIICTTAFLSLLIELERYRG